jgi:hypothetical protein
LIHFLRIYAVLDFVEVEDGDLEVAVLELQQGHGFVVFVGKVVV